MSSSKRYLFVSAISLILSLNTWAEAPVVDESEHFAFSDGQQPAQASAGQSKYDEPLVKEDSPRTDDYSMNQEEGALVRENPSQSFEGNDNASLIGKIQALQHEIQELRGQLEVQAHDLKLLQQQQLSFYKDLDTRLESKGTQESTTKPLDPVLVPKAKTESLVQPKLGVKAQSNSSIQPEPVLPVSRTNPADEQISYMAAYELVKLRHYEDALNAMELFVKKYPQGGYAANAEYWIGELFLIKKDYPKAIDHFQIVLKQFASSEKSAASMLKLGYAYAAIGETQKAKKWLEQVRISYPNSPTALLADTKLQAIKAL